MYLGGSSYTGKIPLEETLSENLDIISYAISPTIFELVKLPNKQDGLPLTMWLYPTRLGSSETR